MNDQLADDHEQRTQEYALRNMTKLGFREFLEQRGEKPGDFEMLLSTDSDCSGINNNIKQLAGIALVAGCTYVTNVEIVSISGTSIRYFCYGNGLVRKPEAEIKTGIYSEATR